MVRATEAEFTRFANNSALTYNTCVPRICLLHGTYKNNGNNFNQNHRFTGQFGIDHALVDGLLAYNQGLGHTYIHFNIC